MACAGAVVASVRGAGADSGDATAGVTVPDPTEAGRHTAHVASGRRTQRTCDAENVSDQRLPTPESTEPIREGMDGSGPIHYQERMVPPVLVWVFAEFIVATLAGAYAYAIGGTRGAVVGAAVLLVVGLLTALALWRTAPVIRVDTRVVRAGRARLPLQFVDRAAAITKSEVTRIGGIDADPTAYLCVRSWNRGGIVIEVSDPQDPHPYWLVASRHPQQLLQAIDRAKHQLD